jgi:hypothetical protein
MILFSKAFMINCRNGGVNTYNFLIKFLSGFYWPVKDSNLHRTFGFAELAEKNV